MEKSEIQIEISDVKFKLSFQMSRGSEQEAAEIQEAGEVVPVARSFMQNT